MPEQLCECEDTGSGYSRMPNSFVLLAHLWALDMYRVMDIGCKEILSDVDLSLKGLPGISFPGQGLDCYYYHLPL